MLGELQRWNSPGFLHAASTSADPVSSRTRHQFGRPLSGIQAGRKSSSQSCPAMIFRVPPEHRLVAVASSPARLVAYSRVDDRAATSIPVTGWLRAAHEGQNGEDAAPKDVDATPPANSTTPRDDRGDSTDEGAASTSDRTSDGQGHGLPVHRRRPVANPNPTQRRI